MNILLLLKLRSYQLKSFQSRGFTLIELLIVVLIMGILATIAIPNLIAQVGKARESEAKSNIGAVNRTQQAYFNEHSEFATSFGALEVPVTNSPYYNYTISPGRIFAHGVNNPKNGTRSYAGGVQYETETRNLRVIVCRGKLAPDYQVNTVISAGVVVTADWNPMQCDFISSEIK